MKKNITLHLARTLVCLFVLSVSSIAFADVEVVTQKPTGREVVHAYRKGFVQYRSGNRIVNKKLEMALGNYIIGDDGCLYIHNIIYGLASDNYLKLPSIGENQWQFKGKVAYPLTASDTSGQYFITRLNSTIDEETYDKTWLPSTNDANGTILFTLDNGEIKMEEAPMDDYNQPSFALGLVNKDGSVEKTLTGNATFGEVNIATVTPPTDHAPIPYQVYFVNDYSEERFDTLSAIITSDAVYLSDPLNKNQKLWMKGVRNGNKVSFSMQYIGPNTQENYHQYLMPSTYTVTNAGSFIYRTYEPVENVTFTLDEANQTLTLDAPFSLTYIEGTNTKYQHESLCAPVFKVLKEVTKAPRIPVWEEKSYDADYNAYLLTFYLFNATPDNDYIDPSKITYNIYADGNTTPLTFTPDTYTGLQEPMTDIPFAFSDYNDFTASDATRYVYVYGEHESLGVSITYHSEQGDYTSDIVWDNNTTTSVHSTNPTAASIAKTEYYDALGRRLLQPQKGITIRKTTFHDGTIQTTKTLK